MCHVLGMPGIEFIFVIKNMDRQANDKLHDIDVFINRVKEKDWRNAVNILL
jgi:hypothetical protein